MTRSNISHTHTSLENRAEVEQAFVDGDSTEAMFRVLMDGDRVDEFEEWAEDALPVDIDRKKWVGFGMEVTLS